MWEGRIVANLETRELECTVNRLGDQHTYLLFESFHLMVGATGEVMEAGVADNDGDLLEDDVYIRESSGVKQKMGWDGSVRSIYAKVFPQD